MEIKPEKQKLMRRDHWMCRLYAFTYGSEYKGRGFCPLFHASWVALGILPFTLLGHGIERGIKIAKDCWPTPKVKLDKPRKKKKYWPTDFELGVRYNGGTEDFYGYAEWRTGIPYEDFLEWEKSNPNWRADYEKVLEKRKEQKEKEDQRQIRLDAAKEKIAKYLQYGVKPGLIFSALTICYFIWKLAAYLIGFITFENIVSAAIILALIAGAGVITWGLVKLCVRGADKLGECSPPKVEIPDFIYEPAAKVVGFFGHLIEFVKSTIEIIWIKKCPIIQWSESNGPIEKIKSE